MLLENTLHLPPRRDQKEKKALSASIREKVLRANDKSSILQRPAPAPEPAAPAPTLPTNFMFSLPTPAGAGAKSMQTDAHRLVES